MRRYAVIPTTGREVLGEAIAAIETQVDDLVVIAHNCGMQVLWTQTVIVPHAQVLEYNEDPPNISRMWNMGLAYAASHSRHEPYQVAIINDDAVVPPGWFDNIADYMTKMQAVAGSVDQFGSGITHTFWAAEPIDLQQRMSGFAFILDGRVNLRLDEQFQWWYGDDDLEWRAREAGGVVRVPGPPVEHRHPGESTVGRMAVIAGEDRQRFIDKWGRAPH